MKRTLSISLSLLMFISAGAQARELFFPLSVAEPRDGGAHIRLRLFNPSTTETIQVVATSVDGSEEEPLFTISIPPRQMIDKQEVSRRAADRGSRSLRLSSDRDFAVTVRALRQGRDADLHESVLPGVDRESGRRSGAFAARETRQGQGVTVVGFTNPSSSVAKISIRLVDAAGSIRESELSVPSFSTREWDAAILFGVSSALLEVSSLDFKSTEPVLGYVTAPSKISEATIYLPAVDARNAITPLAGPSRRRAVRHPVIAAAPDLSVVTTVSNAAPVIDDNVTYTVTVRNDGPGTASGVQVSFNLPSFTTFVSATASVGSYNISSQQWTISTLQAGATATLQVVAKAAPGSSGSNEGCANFVSSSPADPNISNNRSCATITIQPPPSTSKNLTVVAFQFGYEITGDQIRVGDTVVVTMRSRDVPHGFLMIDPAGRTVVDGSFGMQNVQQTFKPTAAGNYQYFCTISACGSGHGRMGGAIQVAP
ncbi:MAG TPA: CARDB domain-containing protein [Thermoanaerobaculia bacterium]|nr:CARDB domain-containing protein [Thermoanaerobaculia bacterium]